MDLQALLAERVLVADGAMGTELLRLGASIGRPCDLLNLERPDWVAQVHRSYVDAGSDLILTNTFGASSINFQRRGIGVDAREVNLAGAKIARDCADAGVLVGGDVGPCGVTFKKAEADAMQATFAGQAQALADGGVDLIVLETFFDLQEALSALAGALTTGLPVIASMTFGVKGGKVATLKGDPAGDCARALAATGAAAVGANCTVTVDDMPAIARALAEATALPLMLQPNAGQPRREGDRFVYDETPEHFADGVAALLTTGARIVGGCCGTDASFIGALRLRVDEK